MKQALAACVSAALGAVVGGTVHAIADVGGYLLSATRRVREAEAAVLEVLDRARCPVEVLPSIASGRWPEA